MRKGSGPKFLLSALAALLVLILAIGTGSAGIGAMDTLRILGSRAFGLPLPASVDPIDVSILWNMRLPRALAAFVTGGALAASGTVMQSILRNPLASSYTLGVSSGASLGASFVIVSGFSLAGLGVFTLPAAGFAAGLATVFLALALSMRLDRNLQNNTIILVGMVISLFVNALLTLVVSMSHDHLQRLIFWQMGTFSGSDWRETGVAAVVTAVCILLLMRHAGEMDLMTFGEEQAMSVGIELRRTKFVLIAIAALLTGTVVSFTGIIGFVDLVAPHVVRRIFGSSHKAVVPASVLFGGAFMTLADMAARTVASPSELPVGAVTALIGAPFFAWVFFAGRKRGV